MFNSTKLVPQSSKKYPSLQKAGLSYTVKLQLYICNVLQLNYTIPDLSNQVIDNLNWWFTCIK